MPLNIDWQQILLHLLNFLILGVGLYLLLYKPVRKFMKKREDGYKEREDKTAEALEEARHSREEYEGRLSTADAEISEMKKHATEEMNAVRAEKLRDAQKEAEDIVSAARASAEKEKKKIIDGVGGDIRDIVNDMAQKVVMSSGVDDAYEKFLSAAEEEEKDGKE